MNIKRIQISLILLFIFIFNNNSVSGKIKPEKELIEQRKNCIIVYGDTRTNHNIHREIVNSIIKLKPIVVFHTGDLVSNGNNENQWNIFNDIVKDLLKTTKFYPALGNHEKNSHLYFDNFELPNNERWYAVDIGNIHFIILDTNPKIEKNSKQYKWLENDLKNIKPNIKYKIAIFHHPPFSSGPHREDEKDLRKSIVPLFEKYGLDIAFSGHDHVYERLFRNNIFYIVTGAGGAPLYEKKRDLPFSQKFISKYSFCCMYKKKNKLIVDVFDRKLKLIDTFYIKK
jgi:predicted phosphodiesterase